MTKKEIAQQPKKTTLPEVMQKYRAVFSIEVPDGFAHIKFSQDGKMLVCWLNEEGYIMDEPQDIPFESVETVADFMRQMRELRLPEYLEK